MKKEIITVLFIFLMVTLAFSAIGSPLSQEGPNWCYEDEHDAFILTKIKSHTFEDVVFFNAFHIKRGKLLDIYVANYYISDEQEVVVSSSLYGDTYFLDINEITFCN